MVMLDRLFANPASTVENLFYFGFLTERLSLKTGRWLTPLLVGLMYMAHEMTNPEYWYESMNFILPFVGVAIFAAIYLWRRSAVVIWLGDGLYRFVGNLF
jgi:Na+-transporting NADH:ubiquinone oxidoreductase subunit NqrB